MSDREQDDGLGGREETAPGPEGRRGRAGWLREPEFRAVLLVWALCCLGQLLMIRSYGISLPWCDEWALVDAAAGEEPLTLGWLWKPANEHRAPLTRLAMYALGRLGSWDMQVMHYAGLGSMAAGALALIVASRSLRGGRSAFSDAFLPLVTLHPWHYESVVVYGYAYALVSGLLCVAVGLAATRWPMRSTRALLAFLAMALAICLSAGPAGNFWAVGLCGVVVVGMFGRRPPRWKACGVVGTAAVASTAALMILAIPDCPAHESYRCASLAGISASALKVSACWLGRPPLMVLWPWASLAVLAPLGLVAAGLGRDAARFFPGRGGRATAEDQGRWGLALFLGSALMVALAIAYGRGNSPFLWDSRYLTLTQPIGLAAYLLATRARVASAVPAALAMFTAVCVGWSWPEAIQTTRWRFEQRVEAQRMLREGTEPVAVAAERHAETLGLTPKVAHTIAGRLLLMREAGLSVFRDRPRWFHGVPIPRPLAWEAESLMAAGDGLRPQGHALAIGGAVLAVEGTGAATAEVEVPVSASYRVCLRLRSSMEARRISLRLDEGAPMELSLVPGPSFVPVVVEPPVRLSEGRHSLEIRCSSPGVLLDLVELVPRPEPMEPGAYAGMLRRRRPR